VFLPLVLACTGERRRQSWGITNNNNQALAHGLKVKSSIKACAFSENHNQSVARGMYFKSRIEVQLRFRKEIDDEKTFEEKKMGGGYYAYVSSKFSNRLLVVDPDPNGDGNPSDATIVGSVGLFASGGTLRDATITGNRGMGGQGLLPIPVVYNGWVQNLPASWKNKLTPAQQNPIP
jgi:hypothetical protein